MMRCCIKRLSRGFAITSPRQGFAKQSLGLSGGIDSALTLAVAVDALGAEHVHAVMMPYLYTADISVADAKASSGDSGV